MKEIELIQLVDNVFKRFCSKINFRTILNLLDMSHGKCSQQQTDEFSVLKFGLQVAKKCN